MKSEAEVKKKIKELNELIKDFNKRIDSDYFDERDVQLKKALMLKLIILEWVMEE